MGAQSGLKSAAFKLDAQNKAYQGASRRRNEIARKGIGEGFGGQRDSVFSVPDSKSDGMQRIAQDQMMQDDAKGIKKGGSPDPQGPGFPPKDVDLPGPKISYQDAKKDWYDNRKDTGESFEEFGNRWRDEQKSRGPGIPKNPDVGIGGGPGLFPPIFPGGGKASGDFKTFRDFLDRLKDYRGGVK